MGDDYIIRSFLEFLVASKGVSENTVCSYKCDLEDLSQFLRSNGLKIVDASYDDLCEYIRSLNVRAYSAATVARRVSAIKGLCIFLYKDRIVHSDLSLSLESCRLGRTLPRVISESDIGILLDIAKADLSAEGKRLYAIVNILYSSGIRISELIHLGFFEIDAMLHEHVGDIGYIIIKGKGNRERLVLLNEVAMDSIRAYLEVRKCFITGENTESRWLFPGAKYDQCISRQRVGQLLKELAISAGIDPEKVSPHKFRHSFATHLLNNGSNIVFIQKMLGHVNLSTTQVYTHVASEQLRDVLSRFHPMSKSKN
ncbi:tyrosine recombinase [Anaplasma phagocytophilum]|uniref:tyrosine recombinase n=1 Tax=Anaplasma phagocytophilum TaxID=948 RepID=UPI00201A57B6